MESKSVMSSSAGQTPITFTWKDRVKRIPMLQKNSAALRELAARVGLTRQLDLKVVEYFDFYPTGEGFRGIKERDEFERGPNADYLHMEGSR